MEAAYWQKIKGILERALELQPGSRFEFLDQVCEGDADLRCEIDELLKFEDAEDGKLDKQAAFAMLENGISAPSLVGTTIGNYQIIGELGKGGMGVVYHAIRADGEFEQKVALKLIKHGMDSVAVLQRFINERQILASLEHPNIARLIDGGTTADGIPYFVMEYVEGEPITDYADAKELRVEQRLDLFREVCTAISFAHQNLVIHRDLKPSNVLVTPNGQVKLLDFGIAKLLKSETDTQTLTQMPAFTPGYASPEQVRGENLTTATDIYSLGVVLYELLTGTRPYQTDRKNISEIIKAVCDTDPPRPSSVVDSPFQKIADDGNRKSRRYRHTNKALRGDLDNIVLKALRKEPDRRYSSVEQFSEDIYRYRAGLPVAARRGTWNYRAQKFIRRNRIAAVAALLVLVTLVGGLGATLYQRNRAQRRFNDVRQIANSFLFEFHDAIKDLPGSTPARELVVKRAVRYLDQLSEESDGDSAVQRELATAYAKIGEIQGNSYYSNLGDTDGAMKSYRRSLEIREKIAASDPGSIELQNELADSHEGVGDILYTIEDLPGGLQAYEKAVAIREKIVSAEPGNLEYRYSLADVLGKRGDISGMEGFSNLGDLPASLESYGRAVTIYEDLVKIAPENEKFQAGYAIKLYYSGMLLSTTGDTKRAIDNGRKAVSIFESLSTANPDNAKYEADLMSVLVFMRFPLVDDGQMAEAVDNARRVITTMEKQASDDPQNAFLKRSLGVSYNSLGRIQTEIGDGGAAIGNHQKALKIVEDLLKVKPDDPGNQRDLALTLEFLANAQLKVGELTGALVNYRKAAGSYEALGGTGDDLAGVYVGIGKCLSKKGDIEESVNNFQQGIRLAEKAVEMAPLNVRKKSQLAIYYLDRGQALSQAEGLDWFDKSKKILSELQAAGKLARNNEKYMDPVRTRQ